ncbi:PREDICTED: RNA exonuclease 1 homolog isoform X2 [Dinoponera quadriceps]|uniref:RNA exonuclease 1 homolog isoform X2 n=1 Tax=Dinoponera quadriceps TaxID=609295 RepID=A0A6P3WS18_DINQU|nr:PREDICTED: RNA exonuclease 1 homolog isoform X2 [Dinoponera quadriceps]
MLPSTGYFKTINCPFYDSGSCDRPYCHFKHARRDGGSSAGVAGMVEAQTTGQTQENKTSSVVTSNSHMLEHLVTEAVKKVLADQEVTDAQKFPENIVSQVVEELKPTLASSSTASMRNTTPNIVGKHIAIPTPITKPVACVYNPTPISELKKRHIPVISYMPTRESRVAVKRKCSPERAKPWLSVVQESSSSQQPEITYKPTAIINTTDQDAVPGYIPTFKSDSSTSNSYDDSNSNDYQSKFKEAYYPKSKKRREEYVPKMVKAPLKTAQQLDDVTVDQFEPELDIIDEIFTASHTAPNVLGQVKVLSSEDSQDYSLDIEPKFSDDELVEDISKDEGGASVKKDEETMDVDEKGKENLQHAKIDEQTSNKGNKVRNNHCDVKTGDTKSSNKSKQYKGSDANKSSDKRKEGVKEDTNKEKEAQSSHSKSKKKDKRDHHSSERKDKDKSGHKSDSKSRHHSSSNKDKDKRRSSRDSKESSHKDRDHSRRDKHSSPKRDRDDHHKSSRHDKHKSKTSSSSKSSKHTASKSDKKHQSGSGRRPSTSSRKSSERKESSSERNSSDGSVDSPLNNTHPFIDDEILELSDSDHDVQEECLKIFQEYQVSEQPKVVSIKESTRREPEDVEEVGRKRVAHPSAATSVTKHVGPSQPPKKLINPQQKMYERWRLLREAAAEKAAAKLAAEAKAQVSSTSALKLSSNVRKESTESTSSISNSHSQLNGNGRVRIAHVPYAKSLAMEKKKVAVMSAKGKDEADSKTPAQTTKGGVRIAHVPQSIPQLVRPEPLQVATQKFPLNVRQYYINIMHDICVQVYTSGDDAAERAVKEELACHDRCKVLPVYKNACILATHRLRKEVDQSKSGGKSAGSSCGMVSHEAVLAGKSKGSWSVVRTKKNVIDYKGSALYSVLKKWIMSEDQLRENGFPRNHPDGPKGRAKVYVINSRNQSVLSKVPNERMCSRCGQAYMVDRHGFSVRQQNCIYHWGRKFTIRGEGKYSCCQQYGSASGCCDAKTHVWDYTDYENLRGYVKTLPKDGSVEEQGVYALDCEMCYTTYGLELTRVTVINDDCNVIYETLVKPQNPIIDYNTRFSGITEEDMKNVTTTLLDVQATFLTMFSDKTILVGHSLESDFKALRLLHDTVVDTSVMFPHKNGYPQKRALKNLCSEFLRKLIQNDIGGHDSKEDAVSCMELILWKVKEEAKLQ